MEVVISKRHHLICKDKIIYRQFKSYNGTFYTKIISDKGGIDQYCENDNVFIWVSEDKKNINFLLDSSNSQSINTCSKILKIDVNKKYALAFCENNFLNIYRIDKYPIHDLHHFPLEGIEEGNTVYFEKNYIVVGSLHKKIILSDLILAVYRKNVKNILMQICKKYNSYINKDVENIILKYL